MKTVQINLREILDLVNAASDYGIYSSMFSQAMAEWAGSVSDAEIQEYADWFLTPEAAEQGYSEEDRDSAIETVTAWRDGFLE